MNVASGSESSLPNPLALYAPVAYIAGEWSP